MFAGPQREELYPTVQPPSRGQMSKLNALLIACFALVLASTARAQNSPGANNAELNGDYAFTFNGFTGGGSAVFAAVARFTADGAGNIANGELDTNGLGPGAVLTAQTFTGTYAIGADNRGVMTLNIAGGTSKFAFAMMANGNAQFIRFDAAGGTGTIGSGTMEKVDTTGFSTAKITADYAFGLAGFDASINRDAFVGRLTADGAGNFANGAGDINAHGSVGSATFTTSRYTVSDTTHGRGTMSLAFSFGGVPYTLNFVFYIVNSGKLLAMETDALTGGLPLLNGVVLQQQTPPGGFSSASLNGGMVIYLTARSVCSIGTAPAAYGVAGLFTANSNGAVTLAYDQNCGGIPSSFTGLSGTYSVASNGRTLITVASGVIAYLVSSNEAFMLVPDSDVLFGFGEPQAAQAFTNSSVSGKYAGLATTPATSGVTIFSGEFTADGASATGSLTGTEDIGDASGPISGQAFSATYSVSSSPINGRGSVTITSPSSQSALAYIISPSRFVILPLGDPNPSVWLFEQSSPPSTLSSLTLSPSSVTGGNSSTGTVTLSVPAPSGDAVVSLSSSDTSVATVPSSVTVPAGATTATFTVNTSTVTTSASVTISASYGGGTQTASLTVTPSPLPTLSSLTLSPTSVVGGAQSSTGTVTLNGPAPAGGAQVLLSSSNTGAATVPSSVIVPAGATSAIFTVNTSMVLISTSATISASYNSTTQTASLAVLL